MSAVSGKLVNENQYQTPPRQRSVIDKSAPSGTRPYSAVYSIPVSKDEFDKGNLTGSNPNQTPIDINISTGSGRNKKDFGKVGTTTINSDGSTQFIPSGNFNQLPESIRNQISSKEGQNTSKQSVNDAAKNGNLRNNLATKGTSADNNNNTESSSSSGSTGDPDSASNNEESTSKITLPSATFGPNTGSKGGQQYPLNMKGDQDRIMFTREEGGSVVIGIQPTIQDSNRVSWGDSKINPLQLAAFEAARELINAENYETELVAQLGFAKDAIKELANNEETRRFVEAFIGAQAVGLDAAIVSARDAFGGQILNPNLELIFTGPTLRTFTFTFKMTPREKSESDAIRGIINFFKSNMAPRSSDLFMKRPQYFNIKYMGKGAASINKIKEKCALTNFSVNYTPDNSYMTYEQDGSMTAYQLTLEFSETSPLTDRDYEGMSDNEISY